MIKLRELLWNPGNYEVRFGEIPSGGGNNRVLKAESIFLEGALEAEEGNERDLEVTLCNSGVRVLLLETVLKQKRISSKILAILLYTLKIFPL